MGPELQDWRCPEYRLMEGPRNFRFPSAKKRPVPTLDHSRGRRRRDWIDWHCTFRYYERISLQDRSFRRNREAAKKQLVTLALKGTVS
jgi:hypothetical protein